MRYTLLIDSKDEKGLIYKISKILFENGFLRYSSFILVGVFLLILLFSNIFILLAIAGLLLYTYFQ